MRRFTIALTGLLLLLSAGHVHAQGVMLPSAGAAGRSFAGATTAAALDAASSMYWNPAAMRSLGHSEVMFGSEFLYADLHLSGEVPAGAVGGVFPATRRAGKTRSDSGLASLPAIAWVNHSEESPITTGLGVVVTSGGSVNFPGSDTNPVLTPQNPPGGGNTAPFTLGFGPQFASIAAFASTSNIAYEVSDDLVVGAGATLDSMLISMSPAFFGPRNPNGTFPGATNSRPFWGGSFRLGALYHAPRCIDIGVSYNSPHWFETFEFNSADENGNALTLELPFTLPQVVSAGVAFRGLKDTLFAVDVRWLDYANAKTLGDSVPDGGTDWDSIWSIALGVQRRISNKATVRAGYLYNENPIDATKTLFNVQLPGFIQHQLSVGGTCMIKDGVAMSLAYVHAFRNEISGPIAIIPGSQVSLDGAMDSLIFSLHFLL